MDPTLSLIAQAALGVLMLFGGFILNGLRTDMKTDREASIAALKEIRDDLKQLNEAVLGKYATKEDVDKWRERHMKEEADWKTTHYTETTRKVEDQRNLDHGIRNDIQLINIAIAKMSGKYMGEQLSAEERSKL